METNCVRRRYNCARDDVVTVEKRTCDGLTDTVDVNGRSCDERNDEAGSSSEKGRNHQDAEPTDIDAVLGACDPLTELLPQGGAAALL